MHQQNENNFDLFTITVFQSLTIPVPSHSSFIYNLLFLFAYGMRNHASNSWSRSLKFKTLALTMLATAISGQSMATTLPSPVWQPVTLSDGTSSDIILRGTAAFHWHEDKQGNA